MKRTISKTLDLWKSSEYRKVLLVRGARQVGKTYSVRELGKEFPYFLEINFEEDQTIHSLFDGNLDVQKIIQNLALQNNIPVIPGKTLVFFDEIQSCPRAIQSLRYFYEKIPDLHIIAAGSLLEFTLEEIPSFGVGRIQSLFMYPLTFNEYLAEIHSSLMPILEEAGITQPVEEPIHHLLSDYYKTYQLIGGMPEVVSTYLRTGDLLLCMQKLDNLVVSFTDDFSKYKKRSPVNILKDVFNSIAHQGGKKFIYNHASDHSGIKAIHGALDLLIQAGLAYKIPHTSASGLPLGAQINQKKFKIIPLDSGIYQRLMGMDLRAYSLANNIQVVNKGSLAEITTGIQLIHNQSPLTRPELYYWHRESKSSNAEIDYVIQHGNNIMPIEVKAGTKGQMQSMHLFLKEKNLKKGIRISMENFGRYGAISIVPLYAVKSMLYSDK
ncbi:MAG: AAA family ATPase [Candidatus Marinimicrobia bacterium]|nr:AAA family ATPase [Candidatus Neomarinimicrobiota bacterium]MBL7010170.1 AAA family ATPase [Candidatus Neomarinimicrobiota bacterium]MBL7030435.1 AAA family ATPase [Candidatus Neomarinimicrobiota bacterium]